MCLKSTQNSQEKNVTCPLKFSMVKWRIEIKHILMKALVGLTFAKVVAESIYCIIGPEKGLIFEDKTRANVYRTRMYRIRGLYFFCESYESFVHKGEIVKYQSQSAVIKVML